MSRVEYQACIHNAYRLLTAAETIGGAVGKVSVETAPRSGQWSSASHADLGLACLQRTCTGDPDELVAHIVVGYAGNDLNDDQFWQVLRQRAEQLSDLPGAQLN